MYRRYRTLFLVLLSFVAFNTQVRSQPCQTPLLPLQEGMTVSTCSSSLAGGPSYVVYVHDVRDPQANSPGFDINWFAPHDNNQSGTAWTSAVLGEVFGVCLDQQPNPNIYVAATTLYNTQSTGIGGAGAVYRLDGTTGAPCVAVELPNASAVGLGNLCFDRQNQQFFVANLEDGLIYRFDGSELACGTTIAQATTYDHGIDGRAAQGLAPILDDPTTLRTSLGRRVFAVQKHPSENRLYYSVIWEVGGYGFTASTPTFDPIEDNEIWSVGLAANGDFLPGTAKREVTLPPHALGPEPIVTDIDFSPATCDMALVERTVNGDYASAHSSNVRVFTGNTGGWAPAPCSVLRVGNYGTGNNSAGGGSHDCEGNLWVTGDALHLGGGSDTLYGLQRIELSDNCGDATGSSNGYLVDLDCEVTMQDKTMLGDVEIYRPNCSACSDCMAVEIQIDCDESGDYPLTISVTNLSGVDAERVRIIPLGGETLSASTFVQSVPNGSTFTGNTILGNAIAGTIACFEIWLLDANLEQCCVQEVCVEVSTCCLDFRVLEIECLPDGEYLLTFEVINDSNIPVDRIFLWPTPVGAFTLAPDSFLLGTPLATGQSSGPLSTVVSARFRKPLSASTSPSTTQ